MNPLRLFLLACAAFGALTSSAWQAGDWLAQLTPQTNVIWRAPLEKGLEAAFDVSLEDGAAGSVALEAGVLRVEKTNDVGLIVITPRAGWTVAEGQIVRASADVSVLRGDFARSTAFVRVFGAKRILAADRACEERIFDRCGPLSRALPNTAPGAFYRKFAHFKPNPVSGRDLRSALVIGGLRSTSLWKNWVVEDDAAAGTRWRAKMKKCAPLDYTKDRVSDAAFKTALETPEHTARVVLRDGNPTLEVDGVPTPPILYKARANTSGGSVSDGRLQYDAGVRIHDITLRLWTNYEQYAPWKKDGTFDAGLAADLVEKEMRVAPEALYWITLSLDPSPTLVAAHPSEAWIDAEGRTLYGEVTHVKKRVRPGETPPKNLWPWVSMHSEIWRETMKRHIASTIAELRRRGLSRRIVGVHLAGSHDGQFAAPAPDYSQPAQAAFRRFLAAKYKTPAALSAAWNRPIANFDAVCLPQFPTTTFLAPEERACRDALDFFKRGPILALEDIGRAIKRDFAKPIVLARWCLGVHKGDYESAYDIGAFLESDVFDALVTQPHYSRRLPGFPLSTRSPLVSYRRHGKLFVNEFDFRTFGAIEPWGFQEASFLADSSAGDATMWQTIHRRAAGKMIAEGMGFWYFDMAGGWYHPESVRAEIAEALRTIRSLPPRAKGCASALLVLDEDGWLIANLPRLRWMPGACLALTEQVEFLGASGVPFDVVLMKDVLADPSLAARYRTLVFSSMFEIDAARRRLIEGLCNGGRSLVFLNETGRVGGASATGFTVVPGLTSADHEIVPEPGVPAALCASAAFADWQQRELGRTNDAYSTFIRPPRSSVAEEPGIRVLARYRADGAPALALRNEKDFRRAYVCDAGGLSPEFFHALVRKSGGYVASRVGVQVETDGCFFMLHAITGGPAMLKLPEAGSLVDLENGARLPAPAGEVKLDLTTGETRWFRRVPLAVDLSQPGDLKALAGARLDGNRVTFDSTGDDVFSLAIQTSSGACDFRNTRVSLRVRFSDPLPVRTDLSIDFRDAAGEVFRYKPVACVREKDGSALLDYAVTEGGTCYPSFGKNRNGRFDGVVRPVALLGTRDPYGAGGWIDYGELAVTGCVRAEPLAELALDVETPVIDETRKPVFLLRNETPRAQHVRGTLHLRDFWNAGVDLPVEATLAPRATARLPCTRSLAGKGIWNVQARLTTESGETAEPRTSFAVLTARTVTSERAKPLFRAGVNYHADRYTREDVEKTMDLLVAAGIKLVRVGGFHFGDVARQPGVYDWAKADAIFKGLKSRGVSVHANIYPGPYWARLKEGYPTNSLPPHSYDIPTRPGLFRDYAAAVAARYGLGIDYYEIGNEWDFNPVRYMPPDEAMRLLREGVAGVKASAPRATVTTCGWAVADSSELGIKGNPGPSGNDGNPGLIERFAAEKGVYDVWALHLHGTFLDYARRLQERVFPLFARTGMDRPWYSDETSDFPIGCPDAAARAVWQKMLYAWAWGSTDYIWYNFRDLQTARAHNEPEQGLVTRDLHPRASFAAFSAFNEAFGGATFAERLKDEIGGVHLYRLTRGDETIYAGWTDVATARESVQLEVPQGAATRIDLMGNRTPLPRQNGTVSFALTRTPAALSVR